MKRDTRQRISYIAIIGGVACILAAGGICLANLIEENRANDYTYDIVSNLHIDTVISDNAEPPQPTNHSNDTDTSEEPKQETITVKGQPYMGILKIDSLGLELPINYKWSYPLLKQTPCRYSGTAETKDLILLAHNYARHFGNIKRLRADDLVIFIDASGKVYRYRVCEVEVLQPTAIADMENSGYHLTLFTCTIGGQSRVTVRCELSD